MSCAAPAISPLPPLIRSERPTGIRRRVFLRRSAAASALAAGRFRWEGFADRADLARHVLGAAAMGVGGVLALGCTIGQGVAGISTLSLGSMLTIAGILAGGALATRALAEGSWREALRLR